MPRCACGLLVLVIWIVPALASQPDNPDRFKLFNNCERINMLVEDLHDGAATIGLTKDRIQTLAESRLRAARLYDSTARFYLYIQVDVLTLEDRRFGAVAIDVSFMKVLYDVVSDRRNVAKTWNRGSYGMHGSGGVGIILQSLSEHLDQFVLEYLRVNAAACEP